MQDRGNSSEKKTSLAYLGIFSDRITTKLSDLAESYIVKRSQSGKYSRRVSFLIAECFQNVIRHSLIENNPGKFDGYRDFFQIDIYDDRVVISSANLIENRHIPTLNEQIDLVNSKDFTELTNMYKEILVKGKLSERGGAGLGLIEMARKSELPLQKHFESLTEDHSRAFISLEISKHGDEANRKSDISDVVVSYNSLIERNIMLYYQGDFSAESNANIIEVLYTNFVDQKNIASEKVRSIIIIIEILQNVSKHGISTDGSKEGVLTLSEQDQKMHISCGNLIDQSKKEILKKVIEAIKSGSMQDVEQQYKASLLAAKLSNEGNSGLGLLEIARFTRNKFNYSLKETPDNQFFYSIDALLD